MITTRFYFIESSALAKMMCQLLAAFDLNVQELKFKFIDVLEANTKEMVGFKIHMSLKYVVKSNQCNIPLIFAGLASDLVIHNHVLARTAGMECALDE